MHLREGPTATAAAASHTPGSLSGSAVWAATVGESSGQPRILPAPPSHCAVGAPGFECGFEFPSLLLFLPLQIFTLTHTHTCTHTHVHTLSHTHHTHGMGGELRIQGLRVRITQTPPAYS